MSSNDASLPPRLPTPRNRPSPRRRLRHRQSPSSFPLPPLFLPVRIFRNQPGPLLHFAQALTRSSRLRSVLQFRRHLRSPPSRHKQHQLPTRLRRRIRHAIVRSASEVDARLRARIQFPDRRNPRQELAQQTRHHRPRHRYLSFPRLQISFAQQSRKNRSRVFRRPSHSRHRRLP